MTPAAAATAAAYGARPVAPTPAAAAPSSSPADNPLLAGLLCTHGGRTGVIRDVLDAILCRVTVDGKVLASGSRGSWVVCVGRVCVRVCVCV